MKTRWVELILHREGVHNWTVRSTPSTMFISGQCCSGWADVENKVIAIHKDYIHNHSLLLHEIAHVVHSEREEIKKDDWHNREFWDIFEQLVRRYTTPVGLVETGTYIPIPRLKQEGGS